MLYGQFVLLTETTLRSGMLGESISFFERNELYLSDVYDMRLDPSRAIALQQAGIIIMPGKIVLLIFEELIPEYLADQFHTYAHGAGIVVPLELTELLNRLFLY